MKQIQFGIIGCGYIGTRHAKHIAANPFGILNAAYDNRIDQANTFHKQFNNCKLATDLEALLNINDIDVVNVCTPNGLHFEHALQVLKSGKHVVIEKPICLKSAEARQLIELAKTNNLRIFVVKQNRYNAPVQALKQLIKENRLGKLFMVSVNCFWNRNAEYYQRSDWKGKKDLDGGTLYTQFSHFIDIFYYLFGNIDQISGCVTNANHEGLIEFEDTGSFTFMFNDHAIGSLNYTTTSFEKNMEGSITVFAENATIKLGGQYLNKLEYQRTAGFDITNLPEEGPANDYGYYQGSMSNHDKVIQNVIETLNGNDEVMTSAEDGMCVVDIIERMYAAAKRV